MKIETLKEKYGEGWIGPNDEILRFLESVGARRSKGNGDFLLVLPDVIRIDEVRQYVPEETLFSIEEEQLNFAYLAASLRDGRVVYAPADILDEDTTCVDCGVDTEEIDEVYYIDERIWQETMGDYDAGWICIGCLEKRLGRRLVPADFPDMCANYDIYRDERPASPRLLSRMGLIAGQVKRPWPRIKDIILFTRLQSERLNHAAR